jgi:hypothetical protein
LNFQDVWIVHLPWDKSMLNEQGLVHQVCFRVCTFVEGKDELLASKLNSLLKHFVHEKCKVSMPSVDVVAHYVSIKTLCMQEMS